MRHRNGRTSSLRRIAVELARASDGERVDDADHDVDGAYRFDGAAFGRMYRAWTRLPLSGAEARVLMCLATYADKFDGRCWPSKCKIMADTGLKRDKVRSALRALENFGILIVESRSHRDSTRYRLLIPTTGLKSAPSRGCNSSPHGAANSQVRGLENQHSEGSISSPRTYQEQIIEPAPAELSTSSPAPLYPPLTDKERAAADVSRARSRERVDEMTARLARGAAIGRTNHG